MIIANHLTTKNFKLNLSLQEASKALFDRGNKTEFFIKNLKLWSRTQEDCFVMFFKFSELVSDKKYF